MEELIERTVYTDRIKGYFDKEPIKIITGIRRCGKSMIMKLLVRDALLWTDAEHIIYLNFEDSELDHLTSYTELNEHLKGLMINDEKYYVFLDEVQDVTGWEKSVNSLRLKNADIYVTGSNSKLLSGEMATFLAGRYVAFETGTLSFREFIDFRKRSGVAKDGTDRYEMLERYIAIGGFPLLSVTEFTDEQARQVVSDIQSSAVLRDVVERYKVKNSPLLNKIIAFVYDSVGSFLSIKRITDHLKSTGNKVDYETVSSYVGHLVSAFIIRRTERYDIKGGRLLEGNDKFYLADHSLQYAVRGMRFTNRPGILENIVHNDLIGRGYNVYVGKAGEKEVDFVATKIDGSIVYVQVCTELRNDDTIEREFCPLEGIKDHHPKYVVTAERHWSENRNGVASIHLADFLLKEEL
ncbi:MAG: ATP-binding protein [Methanomassiliicoccaceae archaeon]|jgi:predicted AAA+ superfamily ATPase|nr:ATP-binding protein [Methanomassiliicoccaceae archaeon]